MCIILKIRKKQSNKKAHTAIFDLIREQELTNHHGVAIIAEDKKGKRTTYRNMSISNKMLNNIISENDDLCVHLRFATVGVISKDNTHFWKIKNWAFAHNGTSTLGSATGIKTDSYLFFEKLWKGGALSEDTPDFVTIQDIAKENNFWGKILLINLKTRDQFLFGEFYKYTNALVDIISSVRIYERRFGFNTHSTKTSLNELGSLSGAYKIRPDKAIEQLNSLKVNPTDKWAEYRFLDQSEWKHNISEFNEGWSVGFQEGYESAIADMRQGRLNEDNPIQGKFMPKQATNRKFML